jgi:hypothetical protein
VAKEWGSVAERDTALQELVKRVLDTGKYELMQLWFDSAVLQKYREDPDSRILRSDSAGRLRGSGGWMINFGISPDDAYIHLPIATAMGIAEREREHWLSHLASPPVGHNFLRMTLNPNACIGDGDSREWK